MLPLQIMLLPTAGPVFPISRPGFANLTFVEQRPPIADALLPLVEHALSQIRT